MNEQRAQAYINLIEQLLACTDDEELNNILQANQELIDPEFLQVMENYAMRLEQQGNNHAARLRNMAQQLGTYHNPTQPQPSNQLPQTVYVLLYNVGTDNEGIHTISKDDKHTILIFESSADATNFARQLGEQIGEQNFPVPSVEAMEAEEIFWFCKKSGYDWEFVAQGTDRTPPSQNQKTVYVLLYNAGTDNEGIHTISHQGRHTILMFESSSDATHFAQQLRDQNFPIPSVDTIEAKTIISFCEEVGYDWEFVPEGANRTPPVNSEVGNKPDKLETAISYYQENPKVYTSEAFSSDRLQAYVDLIEQLLACANDEERTNILQANQELIDPKFLQLMETYATWLEEQGNNNDTAWLRNMAQQLRQYLNPQGVNRLEYEIFLLEVLQAENESNSDPAVVYPILQRRQHLLDDTFAQLLQQYARKAEEEAGIGEVKRKVIQNLCNKLQQFPLGSRADNLEIAITGYQTLLEVYSSDGFPEDWAMTQNNLGAAYRYRIRGERADNLELAIAAYHLSLEVYTREAFPDEWARRQNNLGEAYSNRIKGERADNLELAIVALNRSLEVYTCEAFPEDWAGTQNNLGIAYSNRIRGERADNLELAIVAYNLSLEVYTHEAFPEYWARSQNNLGTAYINRIRGERADNLELAIVALSLSLEVYTRDAFSYEWARSQNNLGAAYRTRIRGERADNLELAIEAFNRSLEVYTREAFPEDWARLKNNLGNAYGTRIRGERADNLELAIAAYHLSLEVYTREAFPKAWARSQNDLGGAYVYRIRGEKADNLELAIAAYNLSLEVYTREAFPEDWARLKNNLGGAYSVRIRGERADNLELAIAAYHLCLEVRTREAFPEEWATTQNNLGIAYGDRIRGERADNLELAIAAFNLSLEVYTPTAFPIDCLRTGRNLGHTANFSGDWETAIKGYNLAIEAVENTRLEALNPQRQQEILSEAMDVYHGIVQSYLNLNQPDRALEYVERSKTRYLVQLLTDRDIYPKGDIPQTIITELDRLRRAIIGEEQQLAIQEQTRNRGEILTLDQQKQPILNDYTHLNHLKQELNQFIDREITKTKIDEDFILTQTVKPIPFQDILSLTDAETCLLQWYITSEKILAFVVSADGNINLWESSEDNRNKLTDLINNYLQLYYSQNGHQEWINQLSDLLQTFSDTLHINDILALIPNTCKRLIIIPYLFLHILPLHALPINDNQILQDKYDVQYAPSCQLFKITQQRQLNDLNSLFAIQNPQNNLLFTDLEVEIIKNLFVQSDILAKQNATEIAIKTHQNFPLANCIHFSCHGTFNPNKPLESALILTKEKTDQEDGYLRLGEIFELNFKNCRLVMLSACETGLIDLNSISDEYIGLPSGFLFAGSPSVVSSLWKVNDLSTAFLLIKFYETLPKNPQKGEIAVSLKNAQKWLQTLTLDQFEQELERFQLQLDKIINQLGGGKRPIFNESLKQIRQRQPYPFKNPYYWAGFIATGF